MNGEHLNILLVEDNEDHAELVQRSFQENQVANRIHHVMDGEAALDYLLRPQPGNGNPRPNLILLDLRLPKVDGLDVLKEIKSHEPLKTIPVVILTSSEAEKDIAMAYAYHANSYLVKPVDFRKFTCMMKDLGFYWLGWNKNPM